MWSLLIITCIISQTAVAFFLLNGVRADDDIDRHLRAMLIILLVHLSAKFLLLAVLNDVFLYAEIPTGFGLAYGPLLLVIARSALGRPMRSRNIFFQFTPFLFFSLIYLGLVIGGAGGGISHRAISGYAAWYEWLVIASLYGYPVYVKRLLRGHRTAKTKLTGQIANMLMTGISLGLLSATLHFTTAVRIPGFDLRLLPYICFSAIPVLILRYQLQRNEEKMGRAAAATDPGPAPDPGAAISSREAIADRRYEKSGLDAAQMDAYEAALAAFMIKSRIYLDPELSLDGLASRMKMPKHHLTQLMNERLMKNFYSLVNEYRIGEAIARLNNTAISVNILSLAFDCGFNSRSSFNNYFKKITGHTPSAYRKLQSDGDAGYPREMPARLIPGTSSSVS